MMQSHLDDDGSSERTEYCPVKPDSIPSEILAQGTVIPSPVGPESAQFASVLRAKQSTEISVPGTPVRCSVTHPLMDLRGQVPPSTD